VDDRTPHQPAGLLDVLAFRVVEHRPTQSAYVLEKRWASDSSVVDPHNARAGIGGEVLRVTVPRRPRRLVGVEQHHRVLRLNGRGVRADTKRVEPIHPDEVGVEGL